VDSEDLKYVSPVIQLRQRLALSTNYRPVLDLRDERFDLVVLRENTEGSTRDSTNIPSLRPCGARSPPIPIHRRVAEKAALSPYGCRRGPRQRRF
jgi:hypothetical protein